MAFFKFRKDGDDTVSAAVPLESVDAMRRRAMHRLIGAVVLVVAGVIGFPMLFDNQPRPIAVDIPIEIPDKAKSRPIVLPTAPSATEATPAAAPAPAVVAKEPPAEAKPVEKSVEKSVTPSVKKSSEPAKPTIAPVSPPVTPPVAAAVPKPAPQPSATSDAAKAQALLEGKSTASPDAAAPSTEGRFVVQVGAFADTAKAKEARSKLERAGLKTYTQVVETKDGQRTRVRVGPFGDKAQAEVSAAKIKALDLPASILVL